MDSGQRKTIAMIKSVIEFLENEGHYGHYEICSDDHHVPSDAAMISISPEGRQMYVHQMDICEICGTTFDPGGWLVTFAQ